MLWPILALITLAVVAAIVWPLVRQRRPAGMQRGDFDRAVYRDQLTELARDIERGVIDPAQANAARLEIERRLLATETAEPGAGESAAAAPVDGVTVVMLAAAVSAGAVALYLALGAPNRADQPFAARQGDQAVAHQDGQTPTDLAASVATLAAKLKEHPDDVDGWLLLARSQGILERWSDAAASYQKAMGLSGNGPEATAGYGEMLVKLADGMVTPAARAAFDAAVARDPGNVAARFYLALGDAQAGKAQAALAAWATLLAEAPPGAGWVGLVRQTMADTAREAGVEIPKEALQAKAKDAGQPAPGPSAADVDAAGQMSAEDRDKMIRGMVAGLAARLEKNPDDIAGWQRLANAYRVLGDDKKAAEAAAHVAPQAPAPAPGPQPADIAAAGKMSPEERQTVIRGMVDGLAARLQQNPDDAAGWQRLANAYRVLGEDKKAADAAARAVALHPNDIPTLLDQAHAMLGAGQGQDPKVLLPEDFIGVMKRVEALDPQQPEALWYLGLSEAQHRDLASAAAHWQRLLGVLDPASRDYKMVQDAVAAIKPKN